jgi:hypothetical protein
MHVRSLSIVVVLAGVAHALGGELKVYPPEVHITGANRTQQLLLVEEENGRVVKDHTNTARFASSSPAVARVTATGLVTALANGEAVISVTVNGRQAARKVTVGNLTKEPEWSFRRHVLPTMTKLGCNSGACHGALAGKGGMKLSLRAFDADSDWFVLTRQALARRIETTRPAESLLLQKAARIVPHGGGRKITEGDDSHTLLLEWIRGGAAGPRQAEAQLERIEVYPPATILEPKDTLQAIVRAVYSDGSSEDVTRWSRFGSSEELVAGVNEGGTIQVNGRGEAAIIVNFGTKVATLTVTSPYPTRLDAAVFAKSPRDNTVDDLILAKLQMLRIPPSEPATDSEFLRRAYLDTCGTLPRVEEAKAFLASTDPLKRAKLIDALLARPEFVDYWAYRWSDLLLVSSRKLPQPAMWAFYRTIRQSVADNQPWDAFARDILTASGSTLSNGGGNYFVLHKDVSELAEATAVTFLGMSIGCAKCHNHPLEKWTQDQYWAFANLFSRVGLKNGDRAGEVLIQPRLDGEAFHLRKGVPMPATPLDGVPLPPDSAEDRRAYFAKWLTAPDNPYFARAIVNRVWKNYMGRGLVEAEDDLRVSNPPSNAELLDALAADLIKHRYDLKHLMRTILNSAAYQRSTRPLPGNAADDRFYSRYLPRRLSGEVILDAYSDITGVPTLFTQLKSAAGDSVVPTASYPAGTRAIQLPDSLVLSQFLESFGRAERVQTCSCERSADASVTQALHLNNGQTLNAKLRDKNSRLGKWLAAGKPDEFIIDQVFWSALTRPPTAEEKHKFQEILSDAARGGVETHREAIEDFVWAVLTGREFLFNH